MDLLIFIEGCFALGNANADIYTTEKKIRNPKKDCSYYPKAEWILFIRITSE